MNEFELIAALTSELATGEGVVVGPGDDCAVVDGDGDREILLKTDAVVEGVHFERETDSRLVGRKALARCLSDIAAMGGSPRHALITLGLPDGFDPGYLKGVYAGLNELAKAHGVSVVGGETTNNGDRLFINIALTGEVEKGRAILRSGAQVGDAVFVSGELGGSLAGHHLKFEPRLKESSWLTAEFEVHSMIDVSDGLAGDLRHIARASGVGAELLETAVPISRSAKRRARDQISSKPPLLAALTDGEDFELLFTIVAAEAVNLLDGWKREFPDVKLSCVGKIVEGDGLRIKDRTGIRELTVEGFTHFAKN